MTTLVAHKKLSDTVVGNGAYTYEPIENWAKLPSGWSFKEIGGVGVDNNDNVYVFNRGEHPMIVFDRDGNFLRSFGEGLFPRAHGVFMAPDDTIWLTDDGDHTVRQCTLQGKVLLTLGICGKPAPFMSGEPFHRCTHTSMSRVSSTFPCSVHWRTVWSPSSVSQIVSSGAMKTPWARGNSPSPNERRKLPSRSNTIIGCSPRLKTKTLSRRSTPTPPISLNDQPGGSFAQFSTGS